MTIFITIISGVLVFIISQFFLKLIVEPLVEYKKTINRIINKLKYYSNTVVNPPLKISPSYVYGEMLLDEEKEARKVFRKLSCELEANYSTIGFKKMFVKIKWILDEEQKNKITEDLIYLSNITGNIDETGNVNVPVEGGKIIDEINKIIKK